jgi:hypothetical protein
LAKSDSNELLVGFAIGAVGMIIVRHVAAAFLISPDLGEIMGDLIPPENGTNAAQATLLLDDEGTRDTRYVRLTTGGI